MARVGLAMLLAVAFVAPARAQVEVDEQTAELAGKVGIDPVDLLGAADTSGTTPFDYLVGTGVLERPGLAVADRRPASRIALVRLTTYLFDGFTYNGERPYLGSTACSTNFAIGTRFRLPDGEVYRCNDRGGGLGSVGWLDLWRASGTVNEYTRRYGFRVPVEVLVP